MRYANSIAICASLLAGLALVSTLRAEKPDSPALRDALAKAELPPSAPLSTADRDYLNTLARDTWNCIHALADETTGLPYDNSDRGELTSVSNIGLYLSCTVAARDLGFVTSDEADALLEKTLTSVEKLKTWHGFQQCWNGVKTLAPGDNDFAISLLDTGNLAAGLMTVERASPRLAPRCRKLLAAMEWRWFYDEKAALLRGGFDTKKNTFNEGWLLSSLGTDALLCQFLAIATGAAPPQMWNKLSCEVETRHEVSYLAPGWQGGGLFMQCISALWLDQRGTMMGRSAENFGYAQLLHGNSIHAPVWGWSASTAPNNDYLGWGKLKDEVVTPHASVLVIERFPTQVIANLKALETLHVRLQGNGFYDCVDWKSGKVGERFLVLDQAMVLISIANALEPKSVRYWFEEHPTTRQGRQRIAAFRAPMFAPGK